METVRIGKGVAVGGTGVALGTTTVIGRFGRTVWVASVGIWEVAPELQADSIANTTHNIIVGNIPDRIR